LKNAYAVIVAAMLMDKMITERLVVRFAEQALVPFITETT
jgi:hypothetical protein